MLRHPEKCCSREEHRTPSGEAQTYFQPADVMPEQAAEKLRNRRLASLERAAASQFAEKMSVSLVLSTRELFFPAPITPRFVFPDYFRRADIPIPGALPACGSKTLQASQIQRCSCQLKHPLHSPSSAKLRLPQSATCLIQLNTCSTRFRFC